MKNGIGNRNIVAPHPCVHLGVIRAPSPPPSSPGQQVRGEAGNVIGGEGLELSQ